MVVCTIFIKGTLIHSIAEDFIAICSLLFMLSNSGYLGSLLTNKKYIHDEIKFRLKAGNSCYYSVQTRLSSRFLSKNL